MLFWIIAVALAGIIIAFLALTLVRGKDTAEHPAAYDLQVYRDQLKEVERDLKRGVIAEADAERTRTEISRRILAADTQIRESASGQSQPRSAAIVAVVLALLIVGGGGAALYLSIGSPGYPDMPLEARFEAAQAQMQNRRSQAEVEASLPAPIQNQADEKYLQLMTELRAKVQELPDDLRGHELLARNEAILGNYPAAWAAQQRVIDIKGAEAHSGDYAQLADLMIRAADGYISPEAEQALKEAMQLDPRNGFARYYSGLLMSQNGRPDLTFRIWRDLLEESPEGAPWVPPIRARIEDLAWVAGVKYTLPAEAPAMNAPGPSADDVEAAQDMSEAERGEMIRGMVSRLADRLATEGGTADEWARLISAYGVLGEAERAAAIWTEAQSVFAGNDEAITILGQAAQAAGIAQ
jgi:cytochrome c-type biogenesis protein CcmH